MPISDTTNWFASFEYSQKPTTNFFVLGVQPRGKICKRAVPEWREGSNTCNRRKQNISLRNLQLQGPGTAKGRCVFHGSLLGVPCHWEYIVRDTDLLVHVEKSLRRRRSKRESLSNTVDISKASRSVDPKRMESFPSPTLGFRYIYDVANGSKNNAVPVSR